MLRIAIVGDFNARHHTHRAMTPSVEHAAAALGVEARGEWVPTKDVASLGADRALGGFDGVWAASASPYESFEGMLSAIEYARSRGVPFAGTCGGFQYSLVEHARNVLGVRDADSAENLPEDQRSGANCVVIPVSCSFGAHDRRDGPVLRDRHRVRLLRGSRLREIYGVDEIAVEHFCSYVMNPEFAERFESAGLRSAARAVSGDGADGDGAKGDVRGVELDRHPFFIATLFHPQLDSRPGAASPLVREFVRAAG